jgi:hypothetical protein
MTKEKRGVLFTAFLMALAVMAMPVAATAQTPEADGGGQEPSATEKEALLPDSSNLAVVSLLIASPGMEGFYALGHSALRLKSPVHGLDLCFSYNTAEEPGPLFNVLLLAGVMKAAYEAVPYDTYMDRYKGEQRGVTEYTLNLTLHEKQELWRLMDQQKHKGPTLPFDFIFNNCTSTLFRCVSTIMEREDFEFPQVEPLTLSTRECFASIYHDTPWLEFMGMTFLSAYAHDKLPIDVMICPELWGKILPQTDIVGNDGSRRPALQGEPRQLLQQQLQVPPLPWTPTRVFAILLAVTLLLTAAQWWFHWRRLPHALDACLFTLHALFSAYLLYASCTRMFGIFANWLLIVFNLLPLFLWIIGRRKAWHRKLWLPYAVVILGMMIFFPLYTGNPELPHQFIFATLLTRCLSKHFETRNAPKP